MPGTPQARCDALRELLRKLRHEASIAAATERRAGFTGLQNDEVEALRRAWNHADVLAHTIIANSVSSELEGAAARLEAHLWLNGGLTNNEPALGAGEEHPLPGNPDAIDLDCLLCEVVDIASLVALSELGALIASAAKRGPREQTAPARFAFDVVARWGEKLSLSADERLAHARPESRAEAMARSGRLFRRTPAADPCRDFDHATEIANHSSAEEFELSRQGR